jgi:hypothetical protein
LVGVFSVISVAMPAMLRCVRVGPRTVLVRGRVDRIGADLDARTVESRRPLLDG